MPPLCRLGVPPELGPANGLFLHYPEFGMSNVLKRFAPQAQVSLVNEWAHATPTGRTNQAPSGSNGQRARPCRRNRLPRHAAQVREIERTSRGLCPARQSKGKGDALDQFSLSPPCGGRRGRMIPFLRSSASAVSSARSALRMLRRPRFPSWHSYGNIWKPGG